MRYLGIDPGDVRIGLALSDEGGLIARPLGIVRHVSRQADAETIARIAREKEAGKIIIGLPLNEEGEIGPQARKVKRWAEALAAATDLPIEFWDESFSSREADSAPRRPAAAANDDRAAAVILQGYLDAHRPRPADIGDGGEGGNSG